MAVLVLILGYIWLGILLIRSARRHASKGLAVVLLFIVLILPFLDAFMGRAVLRNKCDKDGNIAISEVVSNVEGIATRGGIFKESPAYYGYRFVEGGYAHSYDSTPYMFQRAEVTDDGTNVTIQKKIRLKAQYLLDEGPREDSTYFRRTRISVKELSTNRELAGFYWFEFRGGWAEKLGGALSDAGPSPVASCGGFDVKKKLTHEMLHKTLQPAPNLALQRDAPQAPRR